MHAVALAARKVADLLLLVAAALLWLSAAPSPQASTAAIHRCLRVTPGHPTTYTPCITRWSRPILNRSRIPFDE